MERKNINKIESNIESISISSIFTLLFLFIIIFLIICTMVVIKRISEDIDETEKASIEYYEYQIYKLIEGREEIQWNNKYHYFEIIEEEETKEELNDY